MRRCRANEHAARLYTIQQLIILI